MPPVNLPGFTCNHVIQLRQDKLDQFKFSSRKIPDAYRPQLEAFLGNWTKNGIAVPGAGRFSYPIFEVPKPDKAEIRWVNDLRQRNSITEQDYTPLPDVNKIRKDAAAANVRSILDLSNAYHQIRIEPGYEIYNTINASD